MTVLRLLQKILTFFRSYYDHIVITLFTFIWFIRYNRLKGIEGIELTTHSIFYHVVALVSINVFLVVFRQITSFSDTLRARSFCLFSFLYIAIYSYHYKTKALLDFSTLFQNFELAFSIYFVDIIASQVGIENLLVAVLISSFSLLLNRFWKVLTYKKSSPSLVTVLLLCVWIGYSISPIPNYDELSYFAKTAYRYWANDVTISIPKGEFPLVQDGRKITPASLEDLSQTPSVVIIQIESFNSRFVLSSGHNGEPYMPFFNKLTKQGLYVENFFGNSIQTARGQFTILSGILPSYKRKVFDKFLHISFYSLPAALSDYGFETIFFQASGSLSFDNTGEAMQALGFNSISTAYNHIQRPTDAWTGYAIPDEQFYKAFFTYLDEKKIKNKPFFALLPTIVTHSKFKTPSSKRAFYQNPTNKFEAYANCIRTADEGLRYFFEELDRRPELKENLIVIITGDHSYPVGIKGIYANEAGYWRESFQTPFLMISPNRIPPRTISNYAFSQIDIAPTVLNAVGLHDVKNHFIGSNMLAKDLLNKPVLLSQPYRGRYFSSIRWPYRYIFHEATYTEQAYNLKTDPLEDNNIIHTLSHELKEAFKADLRTIRLNQQAINSNAVWPSS